mmetsp:Transcript_7626/g.18353  ORF Transcript_7626/g.18353 Transcript_7626/m.18353 type:complete len:331 (+) Transcript_7626:300-1292(+)
MRLARHAFCRLDLCRHFLRRAAGHRAGRLVRAHLPRHTPSRLPRRVPVVPLLGHHFSQRGGEAAWIGFAHAPLHRALQRARPDAEDHRRDEGEVDEDGAGHRLGGRVVAPDQPRQLREEGEDGVEQQQPHDLPSRRQRRVEPHAVARPAVEVEADVARAVAAAQVHVVRQPPRQRDEGDVGEEQREDLDAHVEPVHRRDALAAPRPVGGVEEQPRLPGAVVRLDPGPAEQQEGEERSPREDEQRPHAGEVDEDARGDEEDEDRVAHQLELRRVRRRLREDGASRRAVDWRDGRGVRRDLRRRDAVHQRAERGDPQAEGELVVEAQVERLA